MPGVVEMSIQTPIVIQNRIVDFISTLVSIYST